LSRIARTAIAVALGTAIAVGLLTGCTPKGPVYVEGGTDYTNATALAVLAKANASPFANRPTADTSKLRHDALAALRLRGATASSAADLITRTFPTTTNGVPVYVERGKFEGKTAVLVVEATGKSSGTLNSKRIWVVGENGDILFAGSR
jgi:hypothetical protein